MTAHENTPSRTFSSIERHEALARAPKSRAEIEQLLLCELQATEDCEGAKGIAVIGYDDRDEDGPNWTIAAFNSGSASDYICERALINIVTRFQRFYELVQKH
jgi:hypothetical protein